jgi:hypothetical protein
MHAHLYTYLHIYIHLISYVTVDFSNLTKEELNCRLQLRKKSKMITIKKLW